MILWAVYFFGLFGLDFLLSRRRRQRRERRAAVITLPTASIRGPYRRRR